MRKFLLLVLVSLASLGSNAQNGLTTSSTPVETFKPHYTGQFDFFVQDAWGVGFMLRREINPYVGLNLIGGSFMSGWGQYETPSNVGIVNARALGIRASYPLAKRLGIFADITPGYTYMYVSIPYYGSRIKGNAHCFGVDYSAGFLVDKHLAIAYNYSLFVNGNGNGSSGIHWGRVSLIF
jgi:hypothetical protein